MRRPARPQGTLISPSVLERGVKYEVVEHTADVGLRAYGRTLEEIFAHAALGMFDLMTDPATVEPRGEVEVRAASDDLESLLVDWLTELLFVHERDHVFLSAFDVRIDGFALEAAVRGEEIDPDRHPLETEVKAVTYHMIEVNVEEGYAFVIFDI